MSSKAIIREFLNYYHDFLTKELENLDGKALFVEDAWHKSDLGYGRTRVLKGGALFEQAGVSFSEIAGARAPKSLLGQFPEIEHATFWGAGVSMVLHPLSPFCPTAHLNFRYFESGDIWWFGGGCDLTPYYANLDDCLHWHKTIKSAIDPHDEQYYPAFKHWCDEYFFNHHRLETRGVGGVFYDYQNGRAGSILKSDFSRKSEQNFANNWVQSEKTWSQLFAFKYDLALSFVRAYFPIIYRNRDTVWGESERAFQLYRRGRYVEFNLLHDRGTLFGLQSRGRVESILVSMPPMVRWEYGYEADAGSREKELTDKFLHRGIDWAGMQPGDKF